MSRRRHNVIQGGFNQFSLSKSENRRSQSAKNFNQNSSNAFQFDIEVTKKNFIETPSDIRQIFNSCDLQLDVDLKSENDFAPSNVSFVKNFILTDEANKYFAYFMAKLPWQQREHKSGQNGPFLEPRLSCWFGEHYEYSGVELDANYDWDPKLFELRVILEGYVSKMRNEQVFFNSVMCNRYDHEKTSIDWHADDEPTLGKNPIIASLSFGCSRVFELCMKSELESYRKSNNETDRLKRLQGSSKLDGSEEKTENHRKYANYRSRNEEQPPFPGCSRLYQYFLESGDLLIMSGSTQDYWMHRVPKEYHDHGPRINLTFRFNKL